MRNCNLHLLLLIVSLSLFACSPQREASDLLRQAQSLVDTQPDKALQLIDSIFYPERSLNRREYMSYLVTRVQARHRNFLPINEDTLIFIARDYFARRNNDARKTALAFFYSGCVYEEQDNFENAMQQFNYAADYAARADDANLQGLIHFYIGDLFANAGLHLEALKEFKKAERFFANVFSDRAMRNRVYSFSAIGRMYSFSGQQTNALAAFHKGLELARSSENNKLLGLLHQNIHLNYFHRGEYGNAEKHLRLSFELNEDITEAPRYYLNFAKLFTNTNQTDSLNLYVNKLRQSVEQSDNLRFKVAVYRFLATDAKARSDFDAAFEYLQKDLVLMEEITRRRLEQTVFEVRQRYNFERMQHRYNEMIINRQWWIIILLSTVIVIAAFFTIYRLIQRKKWKEAVERIEILETINQHLEKNLQQKNSNNRKDLTWRFDVEKLVAEVSRSKDATETKLTLNKLNKILYGQQSIDGRWEAQLNMLHTVRPGFINKIKEKYPTLPEIEFRICILAYLGFSNRDTAIVLGTAENTIQTYRTKLRKNIGLDSAGDIADYLDKEIGW